MAAAKLELNYFCAIYDRYGMVLPQEPSVLTAEEVLTAYATIRGFMATGGRPDQVTMISKTLPVG